MGSTESALRAGARQAIAARYFVFVISSREGGLQDLVQFASPRARSIGNFELLSEVESTS
jgi:hypothetical protein